VDPVSTGPYVDVEADDLVAGHDGEHGVAVTAAPLSNDTFIAGGVAAAVGATVPGLIGRLRPDRPKPASHVERRVELGRHNNPARRGADLAWCSLLISL